MNIDTQQLKAEYEIAFMTKVQVLAHKRAELFTQKDMAAFSGKSLRTIQKFESYKCFDAYLLYIYKRLLCDL